MRRLVARARRRAPRGARVEVEVQDLRLLAAVLAGGADVVMFDNLTPAQMRRGVGVVRAFARGAGRRILTEASGGIAPERVAVVARTGVDRISLGALTHSAPALDFSLDIEYG